ncbi:HAD hydrolase family protein, partial [Listeria monocytogenes]|nr:HAD hydrolase family protein [Listeria monocytogenes]
MIKVIASDMDGTLLNSDIEIAQENVEAIEKAR